MINMSFTSVLALDGWLLMYGKQTRKTNSANNIWRIGSFILPRNFVQLSGNNDEMVDTIILAVEQIMSEFTYENHWWETDHREKNIHHFIYGM